MKWKNKGHQLDSIGHLLDNKKSIYIYGASEWANEIILILNKCKKWLKWEINFIDRDCSKQKNGYLNFPVISPEEFFKLDKNDLFVVVCANKNSMNEMFLNLINHGFLINKNAFSGFYFLYYYLSVYFLYTYNMTFFTSQNIMPSTVCNLNCRHCLNFTPFIKNHTIYDLEMLKEDIDIYFKNVDLTYRFQITGGEPFLYPHLEELISYISDNYKEKILQLETISNGSVIPNDSLCKTLKDNEITIYIDDYRCSLPELKEKYSKVILKLKKYNIKLIENVVDTWMNLAPETTDNSGFSERELELLFNRCSNPWSTLSNKKISSCNYHHYAEKAGLCEYDSTNYLDLTKITPEKKNELVEFRLRCNEKGYVGLCKHCAGWGDINPYSVKPAVQAPKI